MPNVIPCGSESLKLAKRDELGRYPDKRSSRSGKGSLKLAKRYELGLFENPAK